VTCFCFDFVLYFFTSFFCQFRCVRVSCEFFIFLSLYIYIIFKYFKKTNLIFKKYSILKNKYFSQKSIILIDWAQ
jgi:hypothetical protein